MRFALALVVGLSIMAAGCAPTVGTREANCDEAAAREIVYRRDGTAIYLGQALLSHGCSNSGAYCHGSGTAENEEENPRHGVPLGFDFDVLPVTSTAGEGAALAALAERQRRVHEHRNDIWAAILDGSMPPGDVGRVVVERTSPFVRIDGPGGVPEDLGETLAPRADADDLREGREAVRNWLACGAPLIERSPQALTFVPSARACGSVEDCPLDFECESDRCVPASCTSEADCARGGCVDGSCVPVACETDADCQPYDCDAATAHCTGVGDVVAGLDVPLPTWTSIYDQVIGPSCGNICHNGGDTAPAGLDMSDRELAWMNLRLPAGTESGMCGDTGLVRVVPFEPENSLLIMKVETPPQRDPSPTEVAPMPTPPCGASMPYGERLSDSTVLAIREWIARGANDD